ncbi:HAMP domain-containing sensor histidine kinase [Microbacterium capsulatum]|uniref:Sensor-like histidine kinase SenX3 n=1 Tax=Microbacterium capsulatum TaxID=3041921 RepID=A0ABU0XGP1_9MICO|nr:HAMP domain-containing sensor histidine kinase [Microbacterium sp. ASV81]MDQ4214301.1 HAMP domain-containing sensor histidine kinase [Microbacterium sp. ASV81]
MARTTSIWRWQLIFGAAVATSAVLIAGLKPTVFARPLFAAGLLMVVLVTVLVIVVPWGRMPARVAQVVPFLDIIAIGLTAQAQDVRLTFLWVFPIVWLASYYSVATILSAIALITASLLVLGTQGGALEDGILRALVTALALGFLGTSIRIGVRRRHAARRLLRRQSEQADRAERRAKTREQQITQIIDALDTALLALAADGTVFKMNEAYRRLYGRDSYGARLPSPAVEYDDREGEPLPPERTTLARAARGEHLQDERVWLFDVEGRWRSLEVSTQSIDSLFDGPRPTLLVVEDVTALREAAEARRTMSAIMSHELRNPLTAILGHIELMLDRDDLPERARDQLEVVEHAGQRMQSLVAAALAEAPAARRVFEPVDLRALVDAAVALFAPTAQAGQQRLAASGSDTVLIQGDPFRLRQVIDNLLSNAVKYTPSGGSIDIDVGVAADGQAELVVVDTGRGMTAADVERIFQPYFRAEEAVRSGVPGTGLGMGVVQGIVTEHGGSVEVGSAPGAGTRIRVRFPRRTIQSEDT